MLIRQRPGSAKGVVFITIEDETGVANLVVWPDVFEKQRKIVMGARLMAVHGIVQRDPDSDVIHVVARRLEDHSPMLRHLSDESHALDSQPRRRAPAAGARPPHATRATPKSSPKAGLSTDSTQFIEGWLHGPHLPQAAGCHFRITKSVTRGELNDEDFRKGIGAKHRTWPTDLVAAAAPAAAAASSKANGRTLTAA